MELIKKMILRISRYFTSLRMLIFKAFNAQMQLKNIRQISILKKMIITYTFQMKETCNGLRRVYIKYTIVYISGEIFKESSLILQKTLN